MISGTLRACLSLLLLSPGWLLASTPEPTPAGIIAGLARQAPARVDFAEIRFLHVTDRPLLAAGQMAWLGGEHLQRIVHQPVAEQVDINGDKVSVQREGHGPRQFSLHRAPELQLMLQSFSAVLSGDIGRLRQAFQLSLQSRPGAAWTLDMVPLDAGLREQMPRIAMDGRGRKLRCLRIEETRGDRSVELLGPLAARMPGRPSIEVLQRLCQGLD